jgi:hypothetical protein
VSLYHDVADTLPEDVVEAIEVSLPCAGGPVHLWNHEVEDCATMGRRPVRVDEWWRCTYCGVETHADPRAPEIQALDRNIVIYRLKD